MNSGISSKSKMRVAWLSAILSILIFAFKYYGYKVTGSTAVLSDALESVVNVVAAWVALFIIRFSAIPADENHPYGHGKAESFSSAFEGGLVFFAALTIIVEAIRAFAGQRELHNIHSGLVFICVAALMNLGLGLYLKKVARESGSQALYASGTHVLSDVWTTVGVMIGLGVVWLTGLWWLDPAIALFFGFYLAYSSFKIVRESVGALMDELDEGMVEELVRKFELHRKPAIIDIHHVRTIRSGNFYHVDAHVVLPEYWDILQAHEFLREFEGRVFTSELDGEFAFHIDPCKKSYCRHCAVLNCPVRQQPLEQIVPFTAKSLTMLNAQSNQ